MTNWHKLKIKPIKKNPSSLGLWHCRVETARGWDNFRLWQLQLLQIVKCHLATSLNSLKILQSPYSHNFKIKTLPLVFHVIWIPQLVKSTEAKRQTPQTPPENIWKLPNSQADNQAVRLIHQKKGARFCIFLEDSFWRETDMHAVCKAASVLPT